MTTALLFSILILQQTAPAAPAPDPATQTGAAQSTYNTIKRLIVRSADKMPAEHFGFQPTPEVRSYGQILAHVVDANYLLCSPAVGQPSPNGEDIQRTEHEKLDRAAMLQRLNESFAWCDKAYSGLSDANAGDTLQLMKTKRPRLALLWFHISHAFEHYGNLVTYMRMKGIVPPSSEPR
jgi:uncharacterized damage-inducible protein DinB